MIQIYADLNCPFCYALSEWVDEAKLNHQVEWRLIEHDPSASFQSYSDQALIELTEEIFIIRQRASDIKIRLPQGRTNARKAERLLSQVKLSHPEYFNPLKKSIYRAYWAEDSDIEDDQVLHRILNGVGLGALEISDQSDEQITSWTREWDAGPYKRTLPVIRHNESDFSLGLGSKKDTLKYLLGRSSSVRDVSDSCRIQIRPQVAMLGDWLKFWNLTKILRDQKDLIYRADLTGLTSSFESNNPPDLVIISYPIVDQTAFDALQAFSLLCERFECPLIMLIDSLSEAQEINLLQMGCSEVISQKSDEYALLKINQQLKSKSIVDRLKANSLVDSLTQLNNRRSFISTLEKEWARAARSKQCLSLLMLDIDYFKAYNDHFGHLAGDGCLRKAAGIIQSHILRSGDSAYRYGGEEFALILPNTGVEGAETKAAEILSGISQAQLDHPTCRRKHVTASIGIISSYHQIEVSINDLIEKADKQLYRAKSEGRNTFKSSSISD